MSNEKFVRIKRLKSHILFMNIIFYGLSAYQSEATVTVIRSACTSGTTWTPAFTTIQNWCLTCICLLGNTSVCRANIFAVQTCNVATVTVATAAPGVTTTTTTTTARPVTTTLPSGQVSVSPVTAPPSVATTVATTTTTGRVGVSPVTAPTAVPTAAATTTAPGGGVITIPPASAPATAATTAISGGIITTVPGGGGPVTIPPVVQPGRRR